MNDDHLADARRLQTLTELHFKSLYEFVRDYGTACHSDNDRKWHDKLKIAKSTLIALGVYDE